ncbi:MAG: flagellin [Thermoguttaceae bacterium]
MSTLTINSSYESLRAARTLQETVSRVNTTLQQLSTGISATPSSDPAGFIASSLMQSDIIAGNQAIKNAQISNAVLSIADSGMSQISQLLNDAKGLAVAAANTGGVTPEMSAAYQQQMDGLLRSVDRVAKTTQYMGMPLLDGSYRDKVAQLGTDVVPSQQVLMTLPNLSTVSLGNESGTLFQVMSGGVASIGNDATRASSIVKGAISQVATARGNVGSLQKDTLNTSVQFMQDYMLQLSQAESLISNTDFAVASSQLVRDSILLQVGTQMLGLSTQNASLAASLLK